MQQESNVVRAYVELDEAYELEAAALFIWLNALLLQYPIFCAICEQERRMALSLKLDRKQTIEQGG